jgi:hypothetical protein
MVVLDKEKDKGLINPPLAAQVTHASSKLASSAPAAPHRHRPAVRREG